MKMEMHIASIDNFILFFYRIIESAWRDSVISHFCIFHGFSSKIKNSENFLGVDFRIKN